MYYTILASALAGNGALIALTRLIAYDDTSLHPHTSDIGRVSQYVFSLYQMLYHAPIYISVSRC